MRQTKLFNRRNSNQQSALLADYPINSRFAEAYRTLRANIQFSFLESEYRSLLVTSATQEEGKTITVANLAHTMAQNGRSVLMIDADLRKPNLSRLMKSAGQSPGLTGLVSGLFGTDLRQGTLTELQLGDLFRLLSLQKKTGILTVTEGNEHFEFSYLKGKLKDIEWKSIPDDKKLSTILLKNGSISRTQLDEAMVRKVDTGQKFGFILNYLGLVKMDDIIAPVTIQMMEALRVALNLHTGRFTFKEYLESDFENTFFYPLDLEKIYKQVILGNEGIPYLQKKISSVLIPTETNNLHLLPAGAIPPDPSELLGSERIVFLIDYLKKKFDVIVIDTPPILPASDAVVLSPVVDGVLLVVKAGKVNRDVVTKSLNQLKRAQANVIGAVLNHVDTKREGYYQYYQKYYGKED